MYLDNWFLGVQRALGGSRRRRGRLPRLARPQRVPQVRHQPVQRRHAGRAVRRHPAGLRGDQLHGVDRPEHVPRRHGRRADEPAPLCSSARAYTFGKATDYLQLVLGGADGPDAYGPPEQEKGPADFDVRQKLALSANWKLPSPGDGALRAIAGGWQLAGVLIAQTGTPFSVVCNGRGFIADPRRGRQHRRQQRLRLQRGQRRQRSAERAERSATRRAACRTTIS